MVKETKRGSKDMLTFDKIIILIHAKNKIESRWFAKENVNMLEVEKKESEGWSTYTIYHVIKKIPLNLRRRIDFVIILRNMSVLFG